MLRASYWLYGEGKSLFIVFLLSSSFELDVVCLVSVIPLQHRSCSVCMSFVRLTTTIAGRLLGHKMENSINNQFT